ncbi:MAG: hypothetical protein HYX90_08140, partial [Chloroflexi bacterium]|nr:hypothetical protein [Chloroflexota bacterium]
MPSCASPRQPTITSGGRQDLRVLGLEIRWTANIMARSTTVERGHVNGAGPLLFSGPAWPELGQQRLEPRGVLPQEGDEPPARLDEVGAGVRGGGSQGPQAGGNEVVASLRMDGDEGGQELGPGAEVGHLSLGARVHEGMDPGRLRRQVGEEPPRLPVGHDHSGEEGAQQLAQLRVAAVELLLGLEADAAGHGAAAGVYAGRLSVRHQGIGLRRPLLHDDEGAQGRRPVELVALDDELGG